MKMILEEYGTTIISGICTMSLVGMAGLMSNDFVDILTKIVERML